MAEVGCYFRVRKGYHDFVCSRHELECCIEISGISVLQAEPQCLMLIDRGVKPNFNTVVPTVPQMNT
jgi:hypothetical protein